MFDWSIAALVTFFAALVQGVIGFGLGVVSVPILTLLDPVFTPIPQLMMSVPLAFGTAFREWTDVDKAGIGWVTLGRLPGAIAGTWLLTRISDDVLGVVIGVIVLAAVVVSNRGWYVPITRTSRLAAGVTAGFTGTTSGIGGPPIALLYRRSRPEEARSTVGALLAIGLFVNLAVLGAAGAIEQSDIDVSLRLVVPALAGFGASSLVKGRVDAGRFRAGVLVVSAVAAGALVLRSLT